MQGEQQAERQCEARLSQFRRIINDLGSRNGTFVNGAAVGTEPVRLNGGDEVVLGGVVSLRFNDPDGTMAGPRLGRLNGVWIDPDTHLVRCREPDGAIKTSRRLYAVGAMTRSQIIDTSMARGIVRSTALVADDLDKYLGSR